VKFTGEIKGFYQRKPGQGETIYFYVHKYENGEVNTAVMDRVDERQQTLR
jgi:hypothetical protein